MTQKKEKIVQTTIRMPIDLRRELSAYLEKRRFTPAHITVDGFINQAVRDKLRRSEGVTELAIAGEVPAVDSLIGEEDELRDLVIEFIRLMRNPLEKDEAFAKVTRQILSQRVAEREK